VLFAVKNHLLPTLLLAALFAAGSLPARAALGLTWQAVALPVLALQVAGGLFLILASDAVIQGALWLLGRGAYGKRFHAFVEYFRPQTPAAIAASGVLAAGEEMLFRGVLLTALVQRAGWTPAAAVAMTACLFGAAHLPRDPRLAFFAAWAVWEGVLLGAIYLATGSLAALLLIHAAHDIGGFAVLAWLRRHRR
jgi:membrane protease YdiL (CAAX protease family)